MLMKLISRLYFINNLHAPFSYESVLHSFSLINVPTVLILWHSLSPTKLHPTLPVNLVKSNALLLQFTLYVTKGSKPFGILSLPVSHLTSSVYITSLIPNGILSFMS